MLLALGTAPADIDRTGNQDGEVCGKPYAPLAAEQVCPDCPVVVLYGFRDNDVTSPSLSR